MKLCTIHNNRGSPSYKWTNQKDSQKPLPSDKQLIMSNLISIGLPAKSMEHNFAKCLVAFPSMTYRGRERSYHGDKEAVAGSHQPHNLQGRLHRFLQFLFLPLHIWTQSLGEPSHHLCSSLMAPWSGVIGVPVGEAGVASQRKMLQGQSTLRWKRWRRPPLLTMLYSQMLALYSRLFLCPLHTAEGPVQMTLRQRQHRCSSHLNFLTLQFTTRNTRLH